MILITDEIAQSLTIGNWIYQKFNYWLDELYLIKTAKPHELLIDWWNIKGGQGRDHAVARQWLSSLANKQYSCYLLTDEEAVELLLKI